MARRTSMASVRYVGGSWTAVAIVTLLALACSQGTDQSASATPSPTTVTPLSVAELQSVRSAVDGYVAEFKSMPMGASMRRQELKELSEKVLVDARYVQQDAKLAALVCRLYAATLLMQNAAAVDPMAQARNAQPYLRRAIELGGGFSDIRELTAAETFFAQMGAGTVASIELKTLLRHQFRVAMVEAEPEEVSQLAEQSAEIVLSLLQPAEGGTSAKEDAEFLTSWTIRLPNGATSTIGNLMTAMRQVTQNRFPDADVGGHAVFAPMPNGNTKVFYIFHNPSGEELKYEWEVSKTRKLVKPLNEATRELMGAN